MARECGAARAPRERGLERLRAAPRASGWRGPARRRRIAFAAHPGATIVAPGRRRPAGGDHFKVFTPYQRAWSGVPERGRGAPRAGCGRPPAASRAAAGARPLPGGAALAAPGPRRRGRGRARRRGPSSATASPPTGAPRRPRRRRHFAARTPPAVRLRLAAGAAARGARAARWRGLRPPALLARLPPPGARRQPEPAPPRLPPARRPLVALAARARGLARGPHRLPARRCRDAPARRRGLHPQPGADGRRLLPHQGPLPRLARRRPPLLGPAQRRRDRQQRRQLAVGRRHRQRHPPQPRPQPGPPGRTVRPRRAATCAATCPSWAGRGRRRSSAPGSIEGFSGSATRGRSSTTTRPSPPSAPTAELNHRGRSSFRVAETTATALGRGA